MTLAEYRRKRSFRHSPEPAGKKARRSPQRLFVVQKHDASHLHYDFRLEHGGVLKSWALPRGPSADPAVRSLAVEVEDHPLEYGSFEGTIPSGQYGGGTVMVWDRGTWEPEGGAAEGLKRGRLTLQLHGERLRGRWSLIRFAGEESGGKRNWLLIKKADAAARAGSARALTERNLRSVATGRSMSEIAAGEPGSRRQTKAAPRAPGGRSRRARRVRQAGREEELRPTSPGGRGVRGALPRSFSPQLAVLTDTVPTGGEWVHEMKYDGYRILAFARRRAVRLITRNGQDWTSRFAPVAEAVAALDLAGTLLDGEVVALNEAGVPDFQSLQRSVRDGNATRLVYFVFDAPFLLGRNLTAESLVERKHRLFEAVFARSARRRADSGIIRYSAHVRGGGEAAMARARRGRFEGVVSKLADSPYHQFRSPTWLKTKCGMRQELVIGGFTVPEGTRSGFGSLLLGYYENGELRYAGRVGTGFSRQSLASLSAQLRRRERKASPFADLSVPRSEGGVHWTRPDLVAEVEFTEWTADGRLRHPSFKGLRADKPARAVRREKARSRT